MRHFLAIYEFEIKNGKIEDLETALDKLKKLHTNEHLCIKLKSKQKERIEENVILNGNLEYGKFGNKRDVINIESSKKTKCIEQNESPLDVYFYIFYFKTDNRGYLVLERIGNIGVRSMLVEALNKHLKSLDVKPITIGYREMLERPIKEIEISVPILPRDIDSIIERRLGKIENKEELIYKIVISAKKNKNLLADFVNKIKQQIRNKEEVNIGTILSEDERINLKVRIGNRIRTVNITKGKLRSWIEIEPTCNRKEEALKIIEDVMKERRE